jgi:hypothetical protein
MRQKELESSKFCARVRPVLVLLAGIVRPFREDFHFVLIEI